MEVVQSKYSSPSCAGRKSNDTRLKCLPCKQAGSLVSISPILPGSALQTNQIQCKGGNPIGGNCQNCTKQGTRCLWKLQSSDDDSLKPSRSGGRLINTKFPYLCPFFVRHPERYGSVPSCSGDGWTDFNKLKYATPRKMKEN